MCPTCSKGLIHTHLSILVLVFAVHLFILLVDLKDKVTACHQLSIHLLSTAEFTGLVMNVWLILHKSDKRLLLLQHAVLARSHGKSMRVFPAVWKDFCGIFSWVKWPCQCVICQWNLCLVLPAKWRASSAVNVPGCHVWILSLGSLSTTCHCWSCSAVRAAHSDLKMIKILDDFHKVFLLSSPKNDLWRAEFFSLHVLESNVSLHDF